MGSRSGIAPNRTLPVPGWPRPPRRPNIFPPGRPDRRCFGEGVMIDGEIIRPVRRDRTGQQLPPILGLNPEKAQHTVTALRNIFAVRRDREHEGLLSRSWSTVVIDLRIGPPRRNLNVFPDIPYDPPPQNAVILAKKEVPRYAMVRCDDSASMLRGRERRAAHDVRRLSDHLPASNVHAARWKPGRRGIIPPSTCAEHPAGIREARDDGLKRRPPLNNSFGNRIYNNQLRRTTSILAGSSNQANEAPLRGCVGERFYSLIGFRSAISPALEAEKLKPKGLPKRQGRDPTRRNKASAVVAGQCT